MDGFWSPATNHRDDEYGGSLDNRLRFTWRVIDAVRKAVGADFVVGIRMVADEDFSAGLSKTEGVEIARRLAASGKFDFLNIIRGSIETDAALTKVIPITGMRSSPHLDFAGEVRAATKFPVFHAARISDVATARHAIATGKLDMVGMTRAHLADPHIVKKVMEGREHEIRPCVGATYCLDRIYEGGEALCIHNAATGREATIPHVDRRTDGPLKKVVVVGAGAGGLEAARVAAERGHPVDGARGVGAGRRAGPARRAEPAPPGADRHRRLAAGGTGAARRRDPLRHLGGAGRCAGAVARRGDRRHRRPAAEPAARGGRRSRHVELGHHRRRRETGRKRAALRRQWRPSGHDGGRADRQCRRRSWSWCRPSASSRRRWAA